MEDKEDDHLSQTSLFSLEEDNSSDSEDDGEEVSARRTFKMYYELRNELILLWSQMWSHVDLDTPRWYLKNTAEAKLFREEINIKTQQIRMYLHRTSSMQRTLRNVNREIPVAEGLIVMMNDLLDRMGARPDETQ